MSTPSTITVNSPIVKIDGQSLFQQAERCNGIIHYQAEVRGGELRARLSCKWEAKANDWTSEWE